LFLKKDTVSCSYLGTNVLTFSCPIKHKLTMDWEMVVNCCQVFFRHSPASMEEQRKISASWHLLSVYLPNTSTAQRLNKPPRQFRLTTVFTLDFTTSDRSKAMLQVFIYFHKSVTVLPQSARGYKGELVRNQTVIMSKTRHVK